MDWLLLSWFISDAFLFICPLVMVFYGIGCVMNSTFGSKRVVLHSLNDMDLPFCP